MSSEQYIHPHGGHGARHGIGCLFGLLWAETSCQRVPDIFAVQSGQWPLLWQRKAPPETWEIAPEETKHFQLHMVFGMVLARMTPYGFWDALGSWHNTKTMQKMRNDTITIPCNYRFI